MRLAIKFIFYGFSACLIASLFSACSNSLYEAGISWERYRAGLSEKSADIKGLHLSYLNGGTGETVLMVHGFGSNKDSWNRFARHLTGKFRIVALDLPGHGDSTSRLELSYDIPSQARRLELFAVKLGLERFHIFGSSMGGAVAIYYTHLFPNRVMTLGLMSSGGVLSPNPSEYLLLLQKGDNPLLVDSREDFDRMLKFVMVEPPYIPWFIQNVVVDNYKARRSINAKIFEDIATEELADIQFLPEIKIPVFILWGRLDRVLDVSSIDVFEKRLPDTKTVILENIGHAPMIEAPQISADHYLHFLETSNN